MAESDTAVQLGDSPMLVREFSNVAFEERSGFAQRRCDFMGEKIRRHIRSTTCFWVPKCESKVLISLRR